MTITRHENGKNINWIFACDCEGQIIWGAYADKSFWERRSSQESWSVRTCKCQTKYMIKPCQEAINDEVVETV